MAALVAVMIMVSIGTFSWASLRDLRVHPKTSSFVMISTVLVVVFTHNLALGVSVGVILSAISFARKAPSSCASAPNSMQRVRRVITSSRAICFFVSATAFAKAFNFREVLSRVTIDVTRAHFWDISSVAALDKVVLKFRRDGTEVNVIGLNEASATLIERVAIHNKAGAADNLPIH